MTTVASDPTIRGLLSPVSHSVHVCLKVARVTVWYFVSGHDKMTGTESEVLVGTLHRFSGLLQPSVVEAGSLIPTTRFQFFLRENHGDYSMFAMIPR